jgi:ATP-binding cassette subfamily F protein uup
VLVLDEPTNDLDLETLELLEAQLAEWPGTLLLVSHDRTFLDNVVTSTLAFEGEGRVVENVGGYEDWLRQSRRQTTARTGGGGTTAVRTSAQMAGAAGARKLSYKERRELDTLPARIEILEEEQRQLQAAVADSEFYRRAADQIAQAMDRLEALEYELIAAYARWHDLEERA